MVWEVGFRPVGDELLAKQVVQMSVDCGPLETSFLSELGVVEGAPLEGLEDGGLTLDLTPHISTPLCLSRFIASLSTSSRIDS